jgi:Pyridoxamine 5'-phosphate oxidase
MAIPLSPEIRELLDGANFAHLATLMPEGHPKACPFGWDVRVVAS